MACEKAVRNAIHHVLGVMDRRGWENLTEESKKAYDALYFLLEGLEGSVEDGSAIVFYNP